MAQETHPSFGLKPVTQRGWWAFGFGLGHIIMFIINQSLLMQLPAQVACRGALLPFYGIFMLLCGLSRGVVATLALVQNHERSWLVWLPLVPAAMVIFPVLGQLLIPH